MVLPWQQNIWWVLTAGMFLAWWAFFARRYSREFTLSERILATFVATVGQILATTFFLGSLHQLGWWQLGVLNAVIACVIALRAGTAKDGRSLAREITLAISSFLRLIRSSLAVRAIVVIAILVSVWVVYLGQLLAPMPWDTWWYHLPWAAFAMQEGHLGPFHQPVVWINAYPMNTQILFLWWLIGTGTERWANVAQAPFAFAGALACYRLARRVGASRKDAVVAGLLILSVPLVIHQMWMAMVDLALMGANTVALAFLSRRRLTTASLMIAGCAAGFVLGTKGSAIYFIVGLFLFLIYRLLPLGMDALKRSRAGRFKAGTWALVVFLGMTFLFGSYFYVRNWASYGNPTGVFTVRVAGVKVFEGDIDVRAHYSRDKLGEALYDALQEGPKWQVVLDGFYDPTRYFSEISYIGGWGSPWTILMLPAIPMAFILGVLWRRWTVPAIMLATLIPFFLFPYNHTELRFHLPVICSGITAFAFVLVMFKGTTVSRILLGSAGVLMFATFFLAGVYDTRLSPQLIEAENLKSYRKTDRINLYYSWGEEFAQGLSWVKQPGTTLGFSEIPPRKKTLALWNPHFSNRAIWVPWEGDEEAWVADMRAMGVDFVYIEPFTEALEYARTDPRTFVPIYEGLSGGIYRLVSE